MVDLWELGPGDRIETRDGADAGIMTETQDGEWINIRYMKVKNFPALVGTEDLCHEGEITRVART